MQVLVRLCILSNFNILKKKKVIAHFLPTFNAISGTTILSLSLSLSYSFNHSLSHSLPHSLSHSSFYLILCVVNMSCKLLWIDSHIMSGEIQALFVISTTVGVSHGCTQA